MERIKRQKLHEKDTLDVPHDIIESILVRLHVKSLLRFKTVSRKWEATISKPIFAQNHLEQSKSTSSRQYIFTEETVVPNEHFGKFKMAQLRNQEFQIDSVLDYPRELGDAYFMCHLEGLLLLRCYKESSYSMDYWDRQYAIWNPSIRTFIMFGYPYSLGRQTMFCGICHDPSGEDYNVVMGDTTSYAVFNCRNKRWSGTKQFPFDTRSYGTDPPGVYFNGSLYWILHKILGPHHQSLNFEIVRFDSRDEKFKEVSKPEGIEDTNYPFFLVSLGGHLCLYRFSMVQIFIMKKDDDLDTWTEFITIENVPPTRYPLSLFMTNENEIVLMDVTSENVIVYNLREKTFQEIDTSMYIDHIFFPFVESLMLDTRRNRGFRRQKAFEELREVFFLM